MKDEVDSIIEDLGRRGKLNEETKYTYIQLIYLIKIKKENE
jgi:hypothetical protein